MVLIVSRSASFDRHVLGALARVDRVKLLRSFENLPKRSRSGRQVVLIHGTSFRPDLDDHLSIVADRSDFAIGIAADRPKLEQLLTLTKFNIRAYFNSYMADTHYVQMIRLLEQGQSWFPPQLLNRILDVARRSVTTGPADDTLELLTPKEKDVALDVAAGMSNKQIADAHSIAERTVKAHLTRIFKKLGISSRVTLALRLRPTLDRAANDA
ncbi:MAG TPA: response regulator transcription factor [Gammaproteobacteria bacterium]